MSENYEGVTVTITTGVGSMKFEFFPDKAPGHVKNFVDLAEKGFYNDTVFHRTIPGFMIQGGCPEGTGRGGPGYQIDAEFNDTPHVRGVLSMARGGSPNSASSQFFVMTADSLFLDNQYSAFGRLVSGYDALDAIASARGARKQDGTITPSQPQKILRAVVLEAGS